MTITPAPKAWTLTAHGVYHKYAGPLTRKVFEQVRKDLGDIRAMDSYEGKTSPMREEAKHALRRILDHEM